MHEIYFAFALLCVWLDGLFFGELLRLFEATPLPELDTINKSCLQPRRVYDNELPKLPETLHPPLSH